MFPWVFEPVLERGAPSPGSLSNPNRRLGREASPPLPGRVMEQSPTSQSPTSRFIFVGIDVSKDRLDVHLRPSGEAFAVARNGAGPDQLVARLAVVVPSLIVLEATGGFERTVAAARAGAGGRAAGRNVLSMATLSAIRWTPVLRDPNEGNPA